MYCDRYVRSHIISSDYEGCVTLWDVDTQTAVNEYEAHDKRIWSVDYCTCDPLLFVSGSDDGFIKVRPAAGFAPRACPSMDMIWLRTLVAVTGIASILNLLWPCKKIHCTTLECTAASSCRSPGAPT